MSPERIKLTRGAGGNGIEPVVRDVRLLDLASRDAAEVLQERAFELGRERGLQAAREGALALLDGAVEAVETQREEAMGALARTSIELATEIARHLLRTEIRAENYPLEQIVRQTLEEAAVGRGPCVVHLNPADQARLANVRFRTGTTIQADDGVPLGDVHVETSLGLMVRETMGALDAIKKRLLEENP